MILSKLKLNNFRSYKSEELLFGPNINIVKGRNGVGKSTVAEAISFVSYGSDTSRSKQVDHLISFDSEECSVSAVFSEADAPVWGAPVFALIRKKRRGQPPVITFARKGMPDIRLTQAELTKMFGASYEVFASCTQVGFFMNLANDRKLDVVGQIACIDRRQLLVSLIPTRVRCYPSCIKFVSPRLDAQNVAVERRQVQNQVAALEGSLSEVKRELSSIQESLKDIDVIAVQQEIEKVQAQADLHNLYAQDLMRYELALARAKELQAKALRQKEDKEKAALEMKALGTRPDSQLAALEEQVVKYVETLKQLRSEIKPKPEKPVLPDIVQEPTCLRCGQIVPEKLKESVITQRENIINEYNKKARAVEDHNQALEIKISDLSKKCNEASAKVGDLWKQSSEWSGIYERLKSRLMATSMEVQLPSPPSKPIGDSNEVAKQLENLKLEYRMAQNIGGNKKVLASTRIDSFKNELRAKLEDLETLSLFEKALHLLPEAELKLMLDKLSGPTSKFVFVDKELMVVDHQNHSYQALSTGQKMKMDLEIVQTLQRLHPVGFCFADNVDLMDDYTSYLPKQSQTILAKIDVNQEKTLVIQL